MARLFENERFHFLLDFLRLERISHDIVYDKYFYLKSKRIYSLSFFFREYLKTDSME